MISSLSARPARKRSRLVGTFGALVAVGCLAGCGDGESEEASETDPIDLLLRMPDVTFEQPGPLTPVPEQDWGAYGGVGWARVEPDTSWKLADGRFYIQANQPRATLRLTAPLPIDREIEVELWCAQRAIGGTGTVQIRLNDEPVHEAKLKDAPETIRFRVPAELWSAGENILAFGTERVETESGPRWDTLAVARVSYGTERRVVIDSKAGRFELPHLAGTRHLIEPNGPAVLLVAGKSDGPGTVRITLGELLASNGSTGKNEPHEKRVDGDFEWGYALPGGTRPGAGNVIVSEITWTADIDATLRLSRYEVIEDHPVPRPPVVLISIDTLAARHMGVYGYHRKNTPRLAAFARDDAVTFERCVANAPWTLPSYLSALTGLYPGSHLVEGLEGGGVALDNFDYWQAAPNRWTLAEALRARGYQTAACLDTLWLSRRFRIDQGFDLYDLGPAAQPFHLPEMGIRLIRDQFERYLSELRDPRAPFFAFIQALDAHGPYFPEEPFRGEFDADLPADLRMTLAGATPQTFGAIPSWMATTMTPDAERATYSEWDVPRELPLERIIARYDEAIKKTDHYIGEIFDLLREHELYDDAVIVITGDHGESFDHGAYSHGVLWEDVITVPFLIKLPGNEHAGERIAQSIQLVDMYPTLFELAGAGPPRDYLHGRSLLPLIRGESDETRPTFSEGGLIDQRTVEENGWKLVEKRPGHKGALASLSTHPLVDRAWLEENLPKLAAAGMLTDELREEYEGRAASRGKPALPPRPDIGAKLESLRKQLAGPYYELYDLNTDPGETVNVAGEEPGRVAELKALMKRKQAEAAASQKDAKPDGAVGPPSVADLEQLRKLGYTGDE